MKKRKAPMALMTILGVLLAMVVVANLRSHNDPNDKSQQQQQQQEQQQQQASNGPSPQVSKEDLSKNLKTQVVTSKDNPLTAKMHAHIGSMILLRGGPGPMMGGKPPVEKKPDLASTTQGEWYRDSSALKH